MEVRIISLTAQPKALTRFRALFDDVQVMPAVDHRETSIQTMVDKGLVSLTAAETMQRGARKWHREFTRGGAVGLAQSMHRVLSRTRPATTWTLMCEEDCDPGEDLPQVVQRLRDGYAHCPYDAAFIGSVFNGSEPSCIQGFGWLVGVMYCTHCILIPPASHEKIAKYLSAPLEVQVDALFAQLHRFGKLKLLMQTGFVHSARQDKTVSTIQGPPCALCNLSPLLGCPPAATAAKPDHGAIWSVCIGMVIGALLTLLIAYFVLRK